MARNTYNKYASIELPTNLKYQILKPKANNLLQVNFKVGTHSVKRNGKTVTQTDYVCGGKLDSNNSTKFIPNDNYYNKIAKTVTPIYNPNPYGTQLAVERGEGDYYLEAGGFACIKKIASDLVLDKILKKVYEKSYEYILDILQFLLQKDDNVIKGIDTHLQKSLSFSNKVYDDKFVSNIFSELTEEQRASFFRLWKDRFKEEFVGVDVTSISSYSKKNIFQFGYNRDKDGLPQINLIVVYGTQSELPLYYEVYDGSINDKTGFLKVLEHLKDLGFKLKDMTFMMDRGFYTGKNIDILNELKLKYIICLYTTYANVREVIKSVGNISNDIENYIEVGGQQFYGKKVPIKGNPNSAYYLFQLSERRDKDMNTLSRKMTKIDEKLDKAIENKIKPYLSGDETYDIDVHEELTKSEETFAKKYYLLDYNEDGSLKSYTHNKVALRELTNTFGYFAFLSNISKLTLLLCIFYYKFRAKSEQAFDSFKCDMDNTKLRTHNVCTRDGKLFVSFLRLILKCYIEKRISDYDKRYINSTKVEKNAMVCLKTQTPHQLLQDLNLVCATNIYKKSYGEISMVLSKKQREMFSLFDIDSTYLSLLTEKPIKKTVL
jgi:transposase